MRARRLRSLVSAPARAALWVSLATATATAQSFPVERPRSLVVGRPSGSRMDRVDGARTGLTPTPLPTSGLHVEWRASTGSAVDDQPLVDARGVVYLVGTRGEVIALARDGTERWRVPTGALDPGPAALLSDDTLVFADASGDAVAVREGSVRWRSRFGRSESVHPSPLPMDDGGVVVATARDLAVLDAQGRQRGRTVLPEATAAPLISALGEVIAVTASGTIWGWVPGAVEVTRLASFGSPIEGGAALANEHTLVAVAAGQTTLSAVDLSRGSGGASIAGAVAPGGSWLGSPAMRGEVATLTMLGPASELVVTIDAKGRELRRALVLGRASLVRTDAGTTPPQGPGMMGAPPLVDAAGTVAFATLEGGVGIAAIGQREGGSVELLSDACPRPVGPGSPAGAVAGLAPLPPQSFLVVCRAGTVLAVTGGGRRTN
jgi:hypothetical protein